MLYSPISISIENERSLLFGFRMANWNLLRIRFKSNNNRNESENKKKYTPIILTISRVRSNHFRWINYIQILTVSGAIGCTKALLMDTTPIKQRILPMNLICNNILILHFWGYWSHDHNDYNWLKILNSNTAPRLFLDTTFIDNHSALIEVVILMCIDLYMQWSLTKKT